MEYTRRTAAVPRSLGARVVVVAAAVGALALGVAHSLAVTSEMSRPTHRANSQSVIQQETCLRQQVREQVPRGSSVFLDGEVFNRLLLEQFIAGWAVPADSASSASLTLTLVEGTAAGCQGQDIRTSAQ